MNGPLSGASLLKRNAASAWHGIHAMDQGGATDLAILHEFNPSDQLVGGNAGGGSWASAATFNDTTNWMIVGFTWDGTGSANAWQWRYKIGAGSWTAENETATNNATAAGPTHRHLIGNVPSLGDDANLDWVCTGLIGSNLGATLHNLDMASIDSWDTIFTGAASWLLGSETIASQTDRTGNGGNELSRSAGVTLVSDPPGWLWGAAAPGIEAFVSRVPAVVGSPAFAPGLRGPGTDSRGDFR